MQVKNIPIPVSLHDAVKAAAALRGTTIGRLAAETLQRERDVERQLRAADPHRQVVR